MNVTSEYINAKIEQQLSVYRADIGSEYGNNLTEELLRPVNDDSVFVQDIRNEVIVGRDDEECKRLYPVSSRVVHKKLGYGTIESVEGDFLTIVFDSGAEKVLSADFCVKNDLLKRIAP